MKKVFIKTFGCQMNVYDSQKIKDLLQVTHNISQIDNEQKADLLLINTCYIREKAQENYFINLDAGGS